MFNGKKEMRHFAMLKNPPSRQHTLEMVIIEDRVPAVTCCVRSIKRQNKVSRVDSHHYTGDTADDQHGAMANDLAPQLRRLWTGSNPIYANSKR